jgi:hypothetical protein
MKITDLLDKRGMIIFSVNYLFYLILSYLFLLGDFRDGEASAMLQSMQLIDN